MYKIFHFNTNSWLSIKFTEGVEIQKFKKYFFILSIIKFEDLFISLPKANVNILFTSKYQLQALNALHIVINNFFQK